MAVFFACQLAVVPSNMRAQSVFQPTIAFPALTNIPLGPVNFLHVSDIAVGDFNGDGRPDLAVLYQAPSNTISILLNDGHGSFQAALDVPLGKVGYSISTGDLNGDGILDLIIPASNNSGPVSLSVLLGNGDGTFQAPLTSSGLLDKFSLADINGDGKLDLVGFVALDDDLLSQLAVSLGNGDGTFQPPVAFGPSSRCYTHLAVGDWNGDGNLDLVVGDVCGASRLLLFTGNGDGSFGTPAILTTPGLGDGASMIAGDFNGDGKLDLAVGTYRAGIVTVALGNGDGTFQKATANAAGLRNSAMVIGDFNQDGKLDLAVSNSDSGDVSVLMGNGDGTFRAALQLPVRGSPVSLFAADFNGDGSPDLLTFNSQTYPPDVSANPVSLLLNNKAGGFDRAIRIGSASPSSIATADFNGDGVPDLAVTSAGLNSVDVLVGDGHGAFKTAVRLATGREPRSVVAGDFNNDGKVDLAVANAQSDDVTLFLGNGDATFQKPIQLSVGAMPNFIAVGDWNQDGKLDLAVANSGSGTISVLLGKGDGSFLPPANIPTGASPTSIAAGDFNGDGIPDLAIANAAASTVSVLLGNGDGTFRLRARLSVRGSPASVVAGDFNRDGKIDLAVANPVHNQGTFEAAFSGLSIFLGNGDGSFGPAAQTAAGTNPLFLALADFDGDGNPDLAVAGADLYVNLLFGKGDGTFQAPTRAVAGWGTWSIAIGDWNGDGRPDLAVANIGASDVSVLFNQSVPSPYPATPTPLSPINNAAVPQNNGACPLDPGRGSGSIYTLRFTESSSPYGIIGYVIAGPVHRGDSYVPMSFFAAEKPEVTIRQCGYVGPGNYDNWTWSVQAVDAAYNTSPFSERATFTFEPCRLKDGTFCH